ncbi:aminopeptidase [Candidatus Woesearchaeota archaeon]|nr:aminopeptidase [Candidatus Woesearchaeota archaeon]
MDKIQFGAWQAINTCLAVQPFERVVIVADGETDTITQSLCAMARAITPHITYFLMEDFGKRPFPMPTAIRQALLNADVSMYTGTYVEGELPLFRQHIYDIVAQGHLRHAGMPWLTATIMEQGMNADYEQIKVLCEKVIAIVTPARHVHVTTALGTDLDVRIGKWKWDICDGHITPGRWSNLPDGEVYTSPESVSGVAIIDGVLGDYFDKKYGDLSSNPVRVEIRDGHAVPGTVTCSNAALENEFDRYIFRPNTPNCNRVGEFAIGTNIFLTEIIGNLLQDEKFPGVHIAFGDCYQSTTGCPLVCDYHIDGVIRKPTVVVDGRTIMVDGTFQF